MSSTRAAATCAVAVTLVALVYLLPATDGRGPEMDEGGAVAYASRVLEGAVPHRDFLTFYGPGSSWAVAGAFAVFGESVGTERAVGLLYRLLVVLGLFLLALRIGGVVPAVIGGFVAMVLLGDELIWAYASYGALAFGLVGLALAALGAAGTERRHTLALVFGGIAAGLAILVRFDFVAAVALGSLPILSLARPRRRWWYAGGVAGALGVYAVHVTIVGPERAARLVGDILASGPGRTLWIPYPWVGPGRLLTAAIVGTLLLVVTGWLRWRRHPDDAVARIVLGAGLFNFAILPLALSRPDIFHIRPASIVPLSLFPAFAVYLARRHEWSPRVVLSVVGGVTLAAALFVIGYGDLTVERARKARNVADYYRGFVDDDNREAIEGVLARTRELAAPGDSLFVGPQDLRRTNYGPTYMYFLLDELRPASYYMEMNPGSANREGSGLADDLRGADWLILTSEWDDWTEPNESMDYGPAEPNAVVREEFCLRFDRGQYRLYERCDRAA